MRARSYCGCDATGCARRARHKERAPSFKGALPFCEARGLGLIQQQFRHLASLRRRSFRRETCKSYFFLVFLGAAFFFIALFNLDLDLAAFFGAFFFTPGIDTSSSFWLLLEKHPAY